VKARDMSVHTRHATGLMSPQSASSYRSASPIYRNCQTRPWHGYLHDRLTPPISKHHSEFEQKPLLDESRILPVMPVHDSQEIPVKEASFTPPVTRHTRKFPSASKGEPVVESAVQEGRTLTDDVETTELARRMGELELFVRQEIQHLQVQSQRAHSELMSLRVQMTSLSRDDVGAQMHEKSATPCARHESQDRTDIEVAALRCRIDVVAQMANSRSKDMETINSTLASIGYVTEQMARNVSNLGLRLDGDERILSEHGMKIDAFARESVAERHIPDFQELLAMNRKYQVRFAESERDSCDCHVGLLDCSTSPRPRRSNLPAHARLSSDQPCRAAPCLTLPTP